MIRLQTLQSKVVSFSYYPLLEIGVGIFLLIAAVIVPILFAVYNGFKISQAGEWTACIVYMLFFLMLGKALTFQKMQVTISQNGNITFFQNMREPNVNITINQNEWQGYTITKETGYNDDSFQVLLLKYNNNLNEFYRSINKKEIIEMANALEQLQKSI